MFAQQVRRREGEKMRGFLSKAAQLLLRGLIARTCAISANKPQKGIGPAAN
ncbi:hypothetical protein RLPCCGM1_p1306 [Rhizobium leguminosarum bv. phaseoli CCGM1]|nr:hypothetical protein RLPCCGM1_p1306 [Rhizobium leguminosarum bv. phaseoli CCGM1]